MASQSALNTHVSEESLIRAGQHGDSQALNTLFRRHRRRLFHSALSILGNPQDAEDALQDGLLSAFRNLKSFKGRSQFSTWLTRVIINAALMRRRGGAFLLSAATAEPITNDEIPITERLVSKALNPEQLLGRAEIQEIIRDHLDALAPILRTAFVLRKVQEYSTSETARMLRVSEETLKGRLRRAQRELAQRVSRNLLQSANAPCNHEYER